MKNMKQSKDEKVLVAREGIKDWKVEEFYLFLVIKAFVLKNNVLWLGIEPNLFENLRFYPNTTALKLRTTEIKNLSR